jgi:AraC-like DNA-binding protein/ligand-binding sensor protein
VDTAERAALHLHRITGLECVYLEVDPTADSGLARGGRCSVCETLLRGHAPPAAADAYHRFAAYEAARLGTSYIYVCRHSLLHVASAVVADGLVHGVLVCGPVVLGTVDEQVVRSLRSSEPASLLSDDALEAWLVALPVLSPAEATALADIAGRVAASLGGDHEAQSGEPGVDLNLGSYLDHLRSMEGDKRSAMPYPIEAEAELRALVAGGNKREATRVLGEICAKVFTQGVTLVEARSRVLELAVLLSRAAIEGGADAEHVFGLEYRSLSVLRDLGTVAMVRGWLERICERFIDLVFDLRHLRFSAHLSRALAVVRSRYGDQITLADAAQAAGVSSGHLGRVFRSEMKVSFSRYLRGVRIQEAKRLLRTTDMTVGEVGFAVGIDDHSYFTHLFRQDVGLAPTDYRDRSRRVAGAGTRMSNSD